MEIEWQDFNEIVLNECNNVKQHAQELESLLADYCYDTPLRSKIDRTLVKLSITSQKLMDLVMPIPSTGEIFGLPREATSNADLPKLGRMQLLCPVIWQVSITSTYPTQK